MIDEKGGTYELTVEKLLPVLDRANRVFVLTSLGDYIRAGRRAYRELLHMLGPTRKITITYHTNGGDIYIR